MPQALIKEGDGKEVLRGRKEGREGDERKREEKNAYRNGIKKKPERFGTSRTRFKERRQKRSYFFKPPAIN